MTKTEPYHFSSLTHSVGVTGPKSKFVMFLSICNHIQTPQQDNKVSELFTTVSIHLVTTAENSTIKAFEEHYPSASTQSARSKTRLTDSFFNGFWVTRDNT